MSKHDLALARNEIYAVTDVISKRKNTANISAVRFLVFN